MHNSSVLGRGRAVMHTRDPPVPFLAPALRLSTTTQGLSNGPQSPYPGRLVPFFRKRGRDIRVVRNRPRRAAVDDDEDRALRKTRYRYLTPRPGTSLPPGPVARCRSGGLPSVFLHVPRPSWLRRTSLAERAGSRPAANQTGPGAEAGGSFRMRAVVGPGGRVAAGWWGGGDGWDAPVKRGQDPADNDKIQQTMDPLAASLFSPSPTSWRERKAYLATHVLYETAYPTPDRGTSRSVSEIRPSHDSSRRVHVRQGKIPPPTPFGSELRAYLLPPSSGFLPTDTRPSCRDQTSQVGGAGDRASTTPAADPDPQIPRS
ncbi:unnamed protein product [Diplocarpon coronariae]